MMVEIYGTKQCGYCKQAVSICEVHKVEYNYIDVGNSTSLQLLTERMGTRPRTVPQIFIDGEYLPGGFVGLSQKLDK